MSKRRQGLSVRWLGPPGQRLLPLLLGLLGGLAGGVLIFLDTRHVLLAAGFTAAIAVYVVIGWNASRSPQTPEQHSPPSAQDQMLLRDATAGTKALALMGLIISAPGFWLMRDDHPVIGIPLLMVAFMPLFVVRRRLTGGAAKTAESDP